MAFALSCTCPGHMAVRRNQERAGIDPAKVVRLMESLRHPDAAKKHLVEVYENAAAQAAGQQPPHRQVSFEGPPREMMEHIVCWLAGRYSDAEAARLLGLTDAEVAAAVAAARK